MQFNQDLLEALLTMRTREAFVFVEDELRAAGYTILTDSDNYTVGIPPGWGKGACPVALVAHLDTLVLQDRLTGAFLKPMELVQNHQTLTNANGVLGADDRAGAYVIVESLRQLETKPLIIFTNYEEMHGIGVKKLIADKVLDPYLKHVRLFLEMDRKGFNEYVYYSWTQPKEVIAFAESFGLVEDRGSYSDVADLTEAYEIPHLNISVGYYEQHTKQESINLYGLAFCMSVVEGMLTSTCVPDVLVPVLPPRPVHKEVVWVNKKPGTFHTPTYDLDDEVELALTEKERLDMDMVIAESVEDMGFTPGEVKAVVARVWKDVTFFSHDGFISMTDMLDSIEHVILEIEGGFWSPTHEDKSAVVVIERPDPRDMPTEWVKASVDGHVAQYSRGYLAKQALLGKVVVLMEKAGQTKNDARRRVKP